MTELYNKSKSGKNILTSKITDKMKKNKKLKIGSININGLSKSDEHQIEKVLHDEDFDIQCISETHRKENEIRSIPQFEDYKVYLQENTLNI